MGLYLDDASRVLWFYATLRVLLLRRARSTLYIYCPYMDRGRLKAGLHRNAFISYPSRLGVHLVEPAFRTITRARSIRSIWKIEIFRKLSPALRFASPRLASPRLASPPLAMHTVAAGSSPVVRTEEWINSELLPPP